MLYRLDHLRYKNFTGMTHFRRSLDAHATLQGRFCSATPDDFDRIVDDR
jgi:hypothetical protein